VNLREFRGGRGSLGERGRRGRERKGAEERESRGDRIGKKKKEEEKRHFREKIEWYDRAAKHGATVPRLGIVLEISGGTVVPLSTVRPCCFSVEHPRAPFFLLSFFLFFWKEIKLGLPPKKRLF